MEEQVKIELPDGSKLEKQQGISVYKVAESIGPRLAKDAVCGRVDGNLVDLSYEIDSDCPLEIVTFDSSVGKDVFWHSTAHVMAAAIKNLFPETKIAIGPPVDKGFYYDLDREESFTPEDLEEIEAEMEKIIEQDIPFEREELSFQEAKEIFSESEEDYKLELLKDIKEENGEKVSIYRTGEFVDLCRGPHLPSTGKITAFKLLSIAGAYWRGDSSNQMLQRIYGISFPKQKLLDEHLEMLEEAKKRDHRKIGKKLDLFSFHKEGPGFPFWHPKGLVIYDELVDFWKKKHKDNGYQMIKTPVILNEELWKKSGHWGNYKDNMYFLDIDEDRYAVKPMNCPGGLLVYKSNLHSYKELPIKYAEMGEVHRHELSGVLHGLFRVRNFKVDDAHIYCTEEQIENEIIEVIQLIIEMYEAFGFNDYRIELSTRPDDYIGSDEIWEHSTEALESALKHNDIDYEINPGDGAFYGPKIDFHIEDCLGRQWQCGTIQLDFSMPERFNLEYVGADGDRHTPVMIHRAAYGSVERFLGILIEHYAGNFPVWLAPVQAIVLPITEDQHDYGEKVYQELDDNGIRAELDDRSEKLSYKIREAETNKIPYIIIVGGDEVEEGTVSVRRHRKGEVGNMTVEKFLEKINYEIDEKVIEEPKGKE